MKNRKNELLGNGLTYVTPKAWVRALSFNKLPIVLTKNVKLSLTKAGSTPLTLIWSDIFDVAYVEE